MVTPASGTVNIYTNFSDGILKLWDEGTSPLTNGTNLSIAGSWFFTCNWSGNENYTADSENWNANVSIHVAPDTIAPVASLGTNPIDNYNSSSNSITFDMKCYDNAAVDIIQLWINTTGIWHANYTNSSYTNNTWLNISVTGIPQGSNHKWAVWCNDTTGLTNITDNRTFSVETGSNVSFCRNLNMANTVYTLIQNVSSPGTCFNITADNVTLDCQGFTINYSLSSSVYGIVSNKINTTIKNCVIKQTSSSYVNAYAIFYINVTNGTIFNNSISTIGNSASGIELWPNSYNNNITNNNITVTGTSTNGIYFGTCSNNYVYNNNIYKTSTGNGGITLASSSSNNHFYYNNITVTNTGVSGVRLYFTSDNNTFINNNIKTSSGDGIVLSSDSTNNIIKDTVINASSSGASSIYSSGSGINNFTNCTFNKSNTNILDTGQINVFWYADVYVNDTGGNPLESVNVSATDTNSILQNWSLTNSSGYIQRLILREYMQNATAMYHDTNYNFNGTLVGYANNWSIVNLTTNYILPSNYIWMTLYESDSTPPLASFGTNPVDNYNDSDGSVTFDMKCSDNLGISTISLYGNWSGTWEANYSNSSYTNDTWLNVSVTGIPDGTNYQWQVWCNDTSSLEDWIGNNRTFTIDTISPYDNNPINAEYVQNTAETIGWILYDSYFSGYYYILRNSSIQNTTASWNNNTILNVFVNTSALGLWNYTILYNDSLGNPNFDEVLITIIPANNPPYWGSNQTDIVSTYSPTTLSYFNITWQDESSISTAWFESNFSSSAMNYSMNSLGLNKYNYSRTLPAGTWYWKSYANDSTNQWNSSNSWIFTIIKNPSSCDVLFNESSPQTYPSVFKVYSNCNSDFVLYRNGSVILNNSEQNLAAGYWNFTVLRTDQENYTNVQDTKFFTINKAAISLNLDALPNWIVDYGTQTNVTGSGCPASVTCNLYRNNTGVNNPEITTLGYGAYNYTYNTSGNENYTGASSSNILTVQNSTGNCNILFNTTSPKTYPYAFLVYTNCDSNFTLYRNGTVIGNNSVQNLAAGYWNFSVIRKDNENYTNYYDEEYFTINKATISLNLASSPSWTNAYLTQTTVNGSNCPSQLTCNLYRDSILASNPEIITLGYGTYNYSYNASGNENYTADSVSNNLIINKNTGPCDVLFNATSPLNYPDSFRVYSNCNSDFTLYRNAVPIANDSVQSLAVGSYSFTVIRTDQENYSNNQDTEFFIINKNIGNCDVLFNETSPLNYPASFIVYSNCNSAFALYINGTAITNNSEQNLAAGYWNFTVLRTDQENYTNVQDTKFFTINKAAISLNLDALPNWIVDYGTQTNVTGSGCPASVTCNLYRNNTGVNNPEITTLGYGAYNYTYNTSGNENYTGASSSNSLIISKNSGNCDVLFNTTNTQTYPYVFKTYSNCNSAFALYINGTAITNNSVQALGAGYYNFSVIRTDQENYTIYYDNESFVMNKVASTCSLIFDQTSPIIYGTQVNASCSCTNSEANAKLYRNNSDVTSENNQLVTLTASSYNYICNVSETQNYTSTSNSSGFIVEKANSDIGLYLNGSRANKNYHNGTSVNFSCRMNSPSQKYVELWTNYSSGINLWNSGISPIEDISQLNNLGIFWFKCNWSGNENYTSDEETWNVAISTILPPEIKLNSPVDNFNSSNYSILFNCSGSDDIKLINVTLYGNWTGSWKANQTNSSPVNSSYNLFIKAIADGTYSWNCLACDNESECRFDESNRTFMIDTTSPIITLPIYTNATKKKNSTSLIFNISAIDTGIGASHCLINIDEQGNQTLLVNNGWCNGTYALTNLTDGNKKIYVYVNDSLRNMALNDSYTVWIDSTNPVASFGTNPVENYISSSSSVSFEMKCSDNIEVNTLELWTNIYGTWTSASTNSYPQNDTSWNTTLSSIPNGNYVWGVRCNDAAGNSNFTTNRTFSVNYNAPHNGGGGGGGGGGSSPISENNANQSELNENISIDNNLQQINGFEENVVIRKINIEGGRGDIINFNLTGSTTSTPEKHKIAFMNVTNDSVTIIIFSDPLMVNLKTGESKKMDINDDSVNDIEIGLVNVISGKANLFINELRAIASICGNTRCELGETNENCPSDCKEGEEYDEPTWNFWGLGAVILILSGLITYIIIARRNQKKNIRTRYILEMD